MGGGGVYLEGLQIIWCGRTWIFFLFPFFILFFLGTWRLQHWPLVWLWADWFVSNSSLHGIVQHFQMFSIKSPELSYQQPVDEAAEDCVSSPFCSNSYERRTEKEHDFIYSFFFFFPFSLPLSSTDRPAELYSWGGKRSALPVSVYLSLCSRETARLCVKWIPLGHQISTNSMPLLCWTRQELVFFLLFFPSMCKSGGGMSERCRRWCGRRGTVP